MNYQKIILAGNVTDAAQQRTSKKGDVAYTTFALAVSEGKERTTYFPITVFGELGKKMAQYITKGRQVLVEGRVEVSEKKRFNVVAHQVRLGAKPRSKKTKASASAKQS
jgi:single-stranded DNA-binding protein